MSDDVAKTYLRPDDINKLPAGKADYRIPYGDDPLQFGDLRLPTGQGPFPIAIVVHGGCWISYFADVAFMNPVAEALTRAGIATWNIEYRRVDHVGGGWPGTFTDVAQAVDHVRELAIAHPLDLQRVIILGHSAGGHLGHWAAARHRLPKDSPLASDNPLPVIGVINISGPGDIKPFLAIQERVCGDVPITRLVGGTPEEVPDRYRQASPVELLPLGIKQVLIIGDHDESVPSEFGRQYEKAGQASGDDVTFIELEDTGHFEAIAPGTLAWAKVEAVARTMLD